MTVVRKDIVKGAFFRLTSGVGGSKNFKKGVIIQIVSTEDCHDFYMYSSSYRSSDGKENNAYDNTIYYRNLETVTEEEIIYMNKPSEVIIVEVGTTNVLKTTQAKKDSVLQVQLTAKPSAKYAVYELAGVAQAEPVPVRFIMAASLD